MLGIEMTKRSGSLTGYLVDKRWKEPFPYDKPESEWPVLEQVFHKNNLITIAGQRYSFQNGLRFGYIAGGGSTTLATRNDTQLGNEYQRFNVSSIIISTGEVKAFAEIPTGTGNATYQEWGVFFNDGSQNINTGTLYSRIIQQFTKNLGDLILLTYTLREIV